MQTAIPGISSDAATEDMEGRNQLPKVPVMGRCRPEFDGSLGLNPNWTWLIRFPLVGVRDSLLEFLDHRLGLCVVVSPGIHAARHRLKRILTLIGLFPHWRALPRVRLTVMVGGRVRRSGRGLKMTCARRPCERATVRVRVVVHPNRWPREGPVRAGAPTSTGIVHPCLRPPAVRRLLAMPSGLGQGPRRRAERGQQQWLRGVCRGHQHVHSG